ncbi:glycoside hydrolase family 2 protein [Curtobacterium sp. MWU13-2055]|uniref:glycoside hydrolase family 2 protein n=1 Tax=Curtobacterium sp. MWU13-2055 TaxID=2931928 RepID=UPI002010A136|nr:glycoside hydrolase family 2 protein [Curtobacterium sp. MWU13-2055]
MSEPTITRQPLDQNWTVEAVTGPTPANFPTAPIRATVPGVVHTDLVAAGLIDDPFDGDNEAAQQWIGDTVWRYRTSFEWHPNGQTRHDLVAEGLDTVAEITLNGTVIARTENQHRTYRIDLRHALRDGSNDLTITFAAPVPETLRRAEINGALPRTNHHEYNQLRKSASNFGWDWGIDAATSGIWRPIAIESWSGVRIASVRPLATLDGGDGILTAHTVIERDGGTSEDIDLAVTIAGQTVWTTVPAGATTNTTTLRVPDAQLWWPVGYGDQHRYDVTITVPGEIWTARVGFRTVVVDTAPDTAGRPFLLTVNGRDVQVRGVNWIPDHAFFTEVDRPRLERRFADMLDGNVNLVRVWGGGMYESDDFYDLADELGVLVWQDFLFACAAYSEEEHLAREVEAEAREHITRLSSRPSLIIWNGSNENIWGSVVWGWLPRLDGRTWGDGYYRDLLPRLVAELDPTSYYSPSSPYSYGDYLHPNDEHHGTMHIWDVWNQRDWRVYGDYQPRFVSEFGFQGPPAWSTLTRVVHDEPMNPYGKQMLVHQKAQLGNHKLARGAAAHFPEFDTIDAWHWGTQLNQAMAIRFGVEHFRSLAPLNTGVILWQLNDNWPVVSWAAVDFDGHRKPLWYAMRDAYAPRLLTIQPRPSQRAIDEAFMGIAPENDSLATVLLNDTDEVVTGLALHVTRRNVDGTVLAEAHLSTDIPARGTATILIPDTVTAFADPATEILVAEVDQNSGFRRAIHDPVELRDQRPDIDAYTADVEAVDGGYRVTVNATGYVRDLFVQADRVDPDAVVDTGLVTLLPGEQTTFRVTSDVTGQSDAFLAPWVISTANEVASVAQKELAR